MVAEENKRKSNAGRKIGTPNKAGSQKPGPKPKHLQHQHSIRGFFSATVNDDNSGGSSSVPFGESSTSPLIDTDLPIATAAAEDDDEPNTEEPPSRSPHHEPIPLEVDSNEVAIEVSDR